MFDPKKARGIKNEDDPLASTQKKAKRNFSFDNSNPNSKANTPMKKDTVNEALRLYGKKSSI